MARWVTGAHGDELFGHGHVGEHGGGYLILFRERDGGEDGRKKKATVVGNFYSEPFLFLIFFF